MKTQYINIVFCRGDDAHEPLNILDTRGINAAIEYLAQWEGDCNEVRDEPAVGESDTVVRRNGYLLTFNNRYGYIGLERIYKE